MKFYKYIFLLLLFLFSNSLFGQTVEKVEVADTNGIIYSSKGGVPTQSDCSTITSGGCIDSDDGKFYVWNGSAVIENTSGAPITQTITDGDTTNAPSGDAVNTALGLKVNTTAIDSASELESVANLGAIFSDLFADTIDSELLFKNAMNACTGTVDAPLAAAPSGACLRAGWIYWADNETAGWNPVADITGETNYAVMYDGASYIALYDEDGNRLESPPPIISGDPDTLDDTLATNGAALYTGGTIIYNAAGEATLDAFTVVGQKVRIKFYTGVAIIVNPAATQTINLRSVNLTEAEALINTSQYGECVLTYLGSNIIDALCSSTITEETP